MISDSVLLNLDGISVKHIEQKNDKYFIYADTISEITLCKKCNTELKAKNTYERTIKDLPAFGKNVILKIKIIEYHCPNCGNIHKPILPFADSHSHYTKRFINAVVNESLNSSDSIAARLYNVSKTTVNNMRKSFRMYLTNRCLPEVIGLDEVHINNLKLPIIIDCISGTIKGLYENVTPKLEDDFFKKNKNNKSVKVFVIDFNRKYKELIRDYFPSAIIVLDKFHVINEFNSAIREDYIHIRENAKTQFEHNFTKGKSVLILKKTSNLTAKDKEQLNAVFSILPAAKKLFTICNSFNKMYSCKDRKTAEKVYSDIINNISPEFTKLNKVIRKFEKYHNEIFNYFDYKYTNGKTEAKNNIVKKIYSFSNGCSFENLRKKVFYKEKDRSVIIPNTYFDLLSNFEKRMYRYYFAINHKEI